MKQSFQQIQERSWQATRLERRKMRRRRLEASDKDAWDQFLETDVRCLPYPVYARTSLSSWSDISFPSRLESCSTLSEALLYGKRRKRSLCKIIPRDHMSDFESTCCSCPVEGEGNDSGEVYSRLCERMSQKRDVYAES